MYNWQVLISASEQQIMTHKDADLRVPVHCCIFMYIALHMQM